MNCIKCGETLPQGALFCPACGKRQTKIPRKSAKRPNGSGTVYRLQGRRSRPWVAAKNKVIVGYYPTKKDAVEALEHLSGQSLAERYNMTFAEVFEAWSAEHYHEVGPKAVEAYNRAFDVFAPLHDKLFRSLRTADFQTVLDPHMAKSHSTVNKYKQLLTQMSTWSIREELISTNFAKFVRLPENVKKEKEIFSDAEIQKLEADGSDAGNGYAYRGIVCPTSGRLPRRLCCRRGENRIRQKPHHPHSPGGKTILCLLCEASNGGAAVIRVRWAKSPSELPQARLLPAP